MTGLAVITAGRMRRAFPTGLALPVMTACAETRRTGLRVIKRDEQQGPTTELMTGFARITAQRVVYPLTQARAGAIMTARLRTRLPYYRIMIKHRIQKADRTVVAYVTLGGRGHMRRMFTQGDRPIMTITAHVRGLIMRKREDHRQPSARVMTTHTIITGQRMGRGFVRGIMAARRDTVTDDGLIVAEWHEHRYPRRGAMTRFAGLGGLRMVCRFAYPTAVAVMTARRTTCRRGLPMVHGT